MTKLTRVINGKTSNKAVNLIANTAGMIATAIAITTSVAVFTPAANAYTTCSTDMWGGTNCYGSGGSSFSADTDMWGNTNYYGTDSNGNSYSGSCSTDSWGNTTCY